MVLGERIFGDVLERAVDSGQIDGADLVTGDLGSGDAGRVVAVVEDLAVSGLAGILVGLRIAAAVSFTAHKSHAAQAERRR